MSGGGRVPSPSVWIEFVLPRALVKSVPVFRVSRESLMFRSRWDPGPHSPMPGGRGTEPNQELVDLCVEHDLTEAHAKVITTQFGVGSIEDLADFFEPEPSPANWRAQVFDDIVQ